MVLSVIDTVQMKAQDNEKPIFIIIRDTSSLDFLLLTLNKKFVYKVQT